MKPTHKTTYYGPAYLEQAFERYYPAIFRYFRYRGVDADTANDLASSVFERALANLHRYDAQKAQFQTWLFTIAHNLAINYWKANSTNPSISLDNTNPVAASDSLPEDVLVLKETMQEILNAMQSLEGRSREIIALKFGGKLTNRQVGKLTDLSESNVGVILFRSMLKLRALLAVHQEARHD